MKLWTKYLVTFLLLTASFLGAGLIFESSLPGRSVASLEYESYAGRPDILEDIIAQKHTLDPQWTKFKWGHLEAVAMFSEIYPKHDIYFLARDGEHLYDTARLLFQDDPNKLSRIHLLNVSRKNLQATQLKRYLIQEGINKESLEAGKKVLFVDTGFVGSIPRELNRFFPERLHSSLQTHLICSSNPAYPSTRSFLVRVDEIASSVLPEDLHDHIRNYEEMVPKFTSTSNRFDRIEGKWQPISPINKENNVSKKLVYKYMEDLRFFVESKRAQKLFNERSELWKKLRSFLLADDRDGLIYFLQKELDQAKSKPFIESIIRDFLEVKKINLKNKMVLELADFGLPMVTDYGLSNANIVIKKYPEWKKLFDSPTIEIEKLMDAKDFSTLEQMANIIKDDHFVRALTFELAEEDTLERRNLIENLINNSNQTIHEFLAVNTFSEEGTEKMRPQLRLLINKAAENRDVETLSHIAGSVFSEEHTKKMNSLVDLLINRAFEIEDRGTLRSFAKYAFSGDHTGGMRNQIELLIKRATSLGDVETLQILARDTFTKEHTFRMKKQVELLIASAMKLKDREVLNILSKRVFQGSYLRSRIDLTSLLIKSAIELSDSETLERLKFKIVGSQYTRASEWSVIKEALQAWDDKRFSLEQFSNHLRLTGDNSCMAFLIRLVRMN